MPNNPFPYLIGFIAGYCAAVFSLMIQRILTQRRQSVNKAAPYLQQPDHSPTLDTRMSNEEWAEAVLAEIVRKAGK